MGDPQSKVYYTLEEYFGLLNASDRRFEYWDGEIVSRSGGSKEHAIIQMNLSLAFGNRLKAPCRPFGSELAVKVAHQAGFVYPDLSVGCNPEYEKHSQVIDMITNPIVLCEIVSPTSGFRDHHSKRKIYQALQSLREYLIIEIESEGPFVTHYLRGPKQWKKHIYDEPSDSIEVSSVGIVLTMAEIYQGIEFTAGC